MAGRKRPTLVKASVVASAALFASALVSASFVAGYSLAFWRVADLYAQTCVLKAKAAELEAEMIHLKNYAVLIDAIAAQGQAAAAISNTPQLSARGRDSTRTKVSEAPGHPEASLK